jgi:hypothetical protein
MKKLTLFATLAIAALMFTSCNKTNYKSFVGTWGVEKIEYYNIDYAGNPIAGSMETYIYDPNDTGNGIHLVFREDKTGEMRDSAIDSVWLYNEETQEYDTCIYRPDTVLVYTFTYTYDASESSLIMKTRYTYPYEYMRTFMMKVSDMTDNSFIYENEYDVNYVERAYLKRVNNVTSKATRQTPKHPNKRGAFLGGK